MHYAKILKTNLSPLVKGEMSVGQRGFIPELEEAFKDGYDTLFKSVENELRGILNEV